MIELSYTIENIRIIEEFLQETKTRISNGIEIVFTAKANSELQDLMLEYDVSVANIEHAILNLTFENYYRGIDLSGSGDFNVCAFRVFVGKAQLEVYLKYGLERKGLQILVFSNHIPHFSMNQPFKK